VSRPDLKFAVVASTAGSVMNEVLKNDFFRSRVHSVIVDRECTALDKARAHGVEAVPFLEEDNDRFCDRLSRHLREHDIDYVFSYYTKFYARGIRDAFADRIINFHPSLLPAFKGMDGFGDTVAYHARYAGNTVEFIADAMDEGKIIMQTACPVDTNVGVDRVRHEIFVQQCKALLQVARWLQDGRISVDGRRVIIADANFEDMRFSPSLDFEDAIRLEPPGPAGRADEGASECT